MKLNIASLVTSLALAATVAADSMIVNNYCLTLICNRPDRSMTAYGDFDVNAEEGCRSTGVPGMVEFYMDWGNARMHFRFNGQSKRCMWETGNDWEKRSDNYDWASCSTSYFTKVACDW